MRANPFSPAKPDAQTIVMESAAPAPTVRTERIPGTSDVCRNTLDLATKGTICYPIC